MIPTQCPPNLERDSKLTQSQEGHPFQLDRTLSVEDQARHQSQMDPINTAGRNWAYILGICVLSQLFIVGTATLYRRQEGLVPPPPGSPEWRHMIPSNLNIDHCIEGDNWTPIKDLVLSHQVVFNDISTSDNQEKDDESNFLQHGVETSFSLPLASDSLFFVTRGQNWNGAIRVKTSSEQANDTANVHIVLRYNHQRAINHIKACLMERRIDENGIGLFGPFFYVGKQPPREETVSTFQITITLPEPKHSSPLRIRNFETDSPNTKHDMDNLIQHVLFDSLSLKGLNGRVDVKSLAVTEGSISTSYGSITGSFNTTNSLSLATSLGAINVNVNLASKNNSIPQFKAQTRRGTLAANIRLTSASPSGKGGIFDITTSNENGRLDIRFPESPMDSTLNLAASTTNERAVVSLHPAYEGTFDVGASTSSDLTQEVSDPPILYTISRVGGGHPLSQIGHHMISAEDSEEQRGRVGMAAFYVVSPSKLHTPRCSLTWAIWCYKEYLPQVVEIPSIDNDYWSITDLGKG